MQVVAVRKIRNIKSGPWLWSSGQRARLLLRRSEFESAKACRFYVNFLFEKTENKQKRPGLAHLKKKYQEQWQSLNAVRLTKPLTEDFMPCLIMA